MKKAKDGDGIIKGRAKTSIFAHLRKDTEKELDKPRQYVNDAKKKNSSSNIEQKTSKKPLVIIVALFLIIVAVPGIYYAIKASKKTPESTISEKDFKEIIETGNKLKYESKYDQAESYWTTLVNSETNLDHKKEYLLQLAVLHEQQGNWQKAFEAYKKIENFGGNNLAMVEGIARCSAQLGDNARAIEYYNKSINTLDKTDPFYEEDVESYKSMISELENAN